jgi:hypothetical protein
MNAYRQTSFDLPNAENNRKLFPNYPGDHRTLPDGLQMSWCPNGHCNEGYTLPSECLECGANLPQSGHEGTDYAEGTGDGDPSGVLQ